MRRFRKRRLPTTGPDGVIRSRERYFTDGRNLYRFVEWLAPRGNAKFATVEDCRTLRLLLVSRDYLTTGRLRPVA